MTLRKPTGTGAMAQDGAPFGPWCISAMNLQQKLSARRARAGST
jgi:hypothetical protein